MARDREDRDAPATEGGSSPRSSGVSRSSTGGSAASRVESDPEIPVDGVDRMDEVRGRGPCS